jgi:hypothetical protein
VYGFEVIIAMFFLATVCVIKEVSSGSGAGMTRPDAQREVEVRFARIDEKRGGGGFV